MARRKRRSDPGLGSTSQLKEYMRCGLGRRDASTSLENDGIELRHFNLDVYDFKGGVKR